MVFVLTFFFVTASCSVISSFYESQYALKYFNTPLFKLLTVKNAFSDLAPREDYFTGGKLYSFIKNLFSFLFKVEKKNRLEFHQLA